MDLNLKQSISNNINSSLQSIPEYNPCNFVEDSLQINNILNSAVRNQSDFKLCLNKMRAILRDNKPLFCSLFSNLIYKYLPLLTSENIVPEEYLYILIDIIRNRPQIQKYFNKWIDDILSSLIKFYANNFESKSNEQIKNICSLIEYWIEEFISSDDKSINNFIFLFEKVNIAVQKMSAFLFFKYIYNYDINKIKIIDWKLFFETCAEILENKNVNEDNKAIIQDIFKQILIYFNKVNVDPNDVLIEGNSYEAAKYFQNITGFNVEKAKIKLKE